MAEAVGELLRVEQRPLAHGLRGHVRYIKEALQHVRAEQPEVVLRLGQAEDEVQAAKHRREPFLPTPGCRPPAGRDPVRGDAQLDAGRRSFRVGFGRIGAKPDAAALAPAARGPLLAPRP